MDPRTFSKKLLGGEIEIVLYTPADDPAGEIVDEAFAEGLRLQHIFNLYDPSSEISILNKKRKGTVSKELLVVLKKALTFSKATKGKYDVTLGKFILERKKGKIVSPTCSYKQISIKKNVIILDHPDMLLDLGSIAKGFIADRMADVLEKNGVKDFLIDARGDMCVRGSFTQIVGVQHPRKKSALCSITLKNQAVATSGDYNQYVGSFKTSHIINQHDLSSVTVVAKTVEEADVFATVLFTCSKTCRKSLLNAHKGLKVLLVSNTGKVTMANSFKDILFEENS